MDADKLADEIVAFMNTELGHDYEDRNGRWVCECGVDLGKVKDYAGFDKKREAHFRDNIKAMIQTFLDDQKDWDAEARKVLSV